MRYNKWIDDFKNNRLSEADRQAFEHELLENQQLQQEWSASALTDDLLQMTANNWQKPSSSAVSHKLTFSKRVLGIAGGLLVVAIGWVVWRNLASQELNPEPKTNEHSERIWEPRFLPKERTNLPILVPQSDADEGSTIQTNPSPPISSGEQMPGKPERKNDIDPVFPDRKPQVERPSKVNVNGQKVEVYAVNIVVDSALQEGTEVVVTATESVILKPGFKAKAGAQFQAKVNPKPFSAASQDR